MNRPTILVCGALFSPLILLSQEPRFEGLLSIPPLHPASMDLHVEVLRSSVRASGKLHLVARDGQRVGALVIERPAEYLSVVLERCGRGDRPAEVVPGSSVVQGAEQFWVSVLTLDSACAAGGFEVSFEVEYVGNGGLSRVLSELVVLHVNDAWYPSPALGQRVVRGTTELSLPGNWRGLSGGALVESEVADGRRVETFRSDQPIGRSFVAAPYEVHEIESDGQSFATYLYPGGTVSAERLLEDIRSIVGAQERHLGVFPYQRIAIAEVPEGVAGWIGLSAEGFVMVRADLTDGPSARPGDRGANVPLLAHEFGHSWWKTERWGSPAGNDRMANEALAQYLATVVIEENEGDERALEFLEFSRDNYIGIQSARGYFQMWSEGVDRPLSRLGSGQVAHDLADAKGPWVYHMLRRLVGDHGFFGILRDLRNEGAFARGEVDLAVLRERFLDRFPDLGLESFFHKWLDQTGAPVIEVEYSPLDESLWQVCMTQHGPLVTSAIDLDVWDGGAARRVDVSLDSAVECRRINVSDQIDSVVVDPDRKLLMWRPSYGELPLLDTATSD